MRLPTEMIEILDRFDRESAPFDESAVRQAIAGIYQQLAPQADAEHNAGMWAEVLAFALWPNAKPSPWGTYFGSSVSGTRQDGTRWYSPDIDGTDPATIPYWIERAHASTHPVLRARYADLAWEMAWLIANTRPDIEMARIAIDSYLDSIPRRADAYHRFPVAIRALDLAIAIGDEGRTDSARAALLGLHREAVASGSQWGQAPQRLLDQPRTRLTDVECEQLLEDLRAVARQRSNVADPKVFDPHATEHAVKLLTKHLRRVGNHAEAREWQGLLGRTFEHFGSLGDPLLASSVLQTAENAFRDAGDREGSRRARRSMETSIESAQERMTPTEIGIPVNPDDDERYLERIVADDIPTTFARLAVSFLDRKERIVAQVAQSAMDAPLQAVIDQTFMYGSQVSAVVGSVDADPEGRLILTASQYMGFSERYLLMAFSRAVTRLEIMPDHFVTWVARHKLFDDLTLVREGVMAWYEGEYVKSIHVLVPQIEHALRSIAGELGLPVTKAAPSGGGASVAINMSDMLYNRPEVTDALGEDLTLHFKALYADPKGFNLRNFLAHGLMDARAMTFGAATRVVHTLLLLGAWKEIAESRKQLASAQEGESRPATDGG